jgi:D-alanyl-D-alanine carboxypeptidase
MKRLTLLITLLLLPNIGAYAVDIPLTCADQKTFELRVSNVIDGCLNSEYSLGAGPIPISLLPKKDLDLNLRYRFLAAQAAAKKEGVALEITSGFRTLSRQKYLFTQAIKKYGSYENAAKWVAPAEISHHPLGLAIDVNYPKDPSSAKWLEINGYKFGLCRVFKNEWWHFEPNIAPGWKCPKMLKDARALLKP